MESREALALAELDRHSLPFTGNTLTSYHGLGYCSEVSGIFSFLFPMWQLITQSLLTKGPYSWKGTRPKKNKRQTQDGQLQSYARGLLAATYLSKSHLRFEIGGYLTIDCHFNLAVLDMQKKPDPHTQSFKLNSNCKQTSLFTSHPLNNLLGAHAGNLEKSDLQDLVLEHSVLGNTRVTPKLLPCNLLGYNWFSFSNPNILLK